MTVARSGTGGDIGEGIRTEVEILARAVRAAESDPLVGCYGPRNPEMLNSLG